MWSLERRLGSIRRTGVKEVLGEKSRCNVSYHDDVLRQTSGFLGIGERLWKDVLIHHVLIKMTSLTFGFLMFSGVR
jgi:hypothetical protein